MNLRVQPHPSGAAVIITMEVGPLAVALQVPLGSVADLACKLHEAKKAAAGSVVVAKDMPKKMQ